MGTHPNNPDVSCSTCVRRNTPFCRLPSKHRGCTWTWWWKDNLKPKKDHIGSRGKVLLDKRHEMQIFKPRSSRSDDSLAKIKCRVSRSSYVVRFLHICHWCNWLLLGHVSNVIERGETSVEQRGRDGGEGGSQPLLRLSQAIISRPYGAVSSRAHPLITNIASRPFAQCTECVMHRLGCRLPIFSTPVQLILPPIWPHELSCELWAHFSTFQWH